MNTLALYIRSYHSAYWLKCKMITASWSTTQWWSWFTLTIVRTCKEVSLARLHIRRFKLLHFAPVLTYFVQLHDIQQPHHAPCFGPTCRSTTEKCVLLRYLPQHFQSIYRNSCTDNWFRVTRHLDLSANHLLVTW